MPQVSHTPRSRKMLEAYGCYVDRSEYWNAFARKRRDLFNVFDLVAIDPKEGMLIGVQVTTRAHLSDRRSKILASIEAYAWVCARGCIQLHGWDKKGTSRKWNCKIEIIGVNDFANASAKA